MPEALRSLMTIGISFWMLMVSVPLTTFPLEGGSVTGLKDGLDEASVEFDSSGADNSTLLTIYGRAGISSARCKITGMADEGGYHPSNPSFDIITNDQTNIWEFSQVGFGPLGNQRVFSDNSPVKEMTFLGPDFNNDANIILPKNATIESATLKVEAIEYDQMSPIKYLGDYNDYPGESEYDVDVCIFGDYLYVAARSFEFRNITDGKDADIRMFRTSNGYNWNTWGNGKEWISISPQGDTGWDWSPRLDVFNNRLYCVFESNDTQYGGEDYDIVITSTSDGSNWDPPTVITTASVEASYSIHDGYGTGAPYDWWPDIEVFNNKLYCVWETNDTTTTGWAAGGMGSDIMIAESSDGTTWSNYENLCDSTTEHDTSKGGDHQPRLFSPSSQDRLWLTFYSNDTWKSTTYDYDIIARFTDNSGVWDTGGQRNGHYEINDATPSNDGWDKIASLVEWNGDLWCIWDTQDEGYSDEQDRDIVCRRLADPTVTLEWNHSYDIHQVNPKGDSMSTDPFSQIGDSWPSACIYNDRLAVAWTSNDEYTTSGADNDVVYSSSADGTTWTIPRENDDQGFISPADDGYTVNDEDWWIKPIVFNDRLFFAWVSENGQSRQQTNPDTDIAVRYLIDSVLPITLKMDMGDDGSFDWGPKAVGVSDVQTVDIADALTSVLETTPDHLWMDDGFGNLYREVPLNLTTMGAGKVRLSSLDINYDYFATTPDFSDELNAFIESAGAPYLNIDVPLTLRSDTPGVIEISDIDIHYSVRPWIDLTYPTEEGVKADRSITIRWVCDDEDSNATISLYYGIDDSISNANLIVDDISEDTDPFEYEWDTQDLPHGQTYHVFAMISDEVTSSWDVTIFKIEIAHIPGEPPSITLTSPEEDNEPAGSSYTITWTDSDPDSSARISLYYFPMNSTILSRSLITSALYEDADGSKGSYVWDTSHVSEGHYKIFAQIDDGSHPIESSVSRGSVHVSRYFLSDVTGLRISDGTLISEGIFSTHSRTPIIRWNEHQVVGVNYHLFVGECDDCTPILNITTKDTKAIVPSDDETYLLKFGNNYLVNIWADDGGYGVTNLTSIQFTVINNAPSSPEAKVLPKGASINTTRNEFYTIEDLQVVMTEESIDPDNDTLFYGYRWVANDVMESNTDELSNSLTKKGDTWTCIVNVSDGLGGFSPEIEVAFSIINSPPSVNIRSPSNDGMEFQHGDSIKLVAEASDPDFEDETRLEYIWESESDGPLVDGKVGDESLFTDDLKRLSPGVHELTLTVTDPDGASGSDTVTIVVVEPEDDKTDGMGWWVYASILLVILLVAIIVIFFYMRDAAKRREKEALDEGLIDEEH